MCTAEAKYRLSDLLNCLSEYPEQHVSYFDADRLVTKTFAELRRDIVEVADSLTAVGVRSGMRLGILGENSYQWLTYELALTTMSVITVAFPVEEFRARTHSEMQKDFALNALLMSAAEHRRRQPELAWVATLAEPNGQESRLAPLDVAHEHDEIVPADIFTMAFSSGTTGSPKCIMFSRCGTEEIIAAYNREFPFRRDDSILVALPLAAYQQRLMVYVAILHGFDIALVSYAELMRGMREMSPTIIAGPPAFYELLEKQIDALSPIKRAILIGAGTALRVLPRVARGPIQKRIFKSYHQIYGGRPRLLMQGMAAGRMKTLKLFGLLGLPLVQVYGLSETGLISWNLPGWNRLGSVGRPIRPNTIELRADGEIVVRNARSPGVGYYRMDAAEQAQVFCQDGTIASGDIGRIDSNGYLHIIGRKKNIIVTRGGCKFHPEPIEQALLAHSMVRQAVVTGGESLGVVCAVIVLTDDSDEREADNVRIFLDEINKGLPAGSQIDRTVFTTEEFTVANGLLSRSLKINRQAVAERFAAQLTTYGGGHGQ